MNNNNYDAFRTFIEGRFGFGGGQSMKKEGQKAPSIDDLKEAGSEEEFKARLKEGQAFRLKEKAGFHVISIDENRPPLVQVVGDRPRWRSIASTSGKGWRSEKRSSHYGRSRPGVDPDGER